MESKLFGEIKMKSDSYSIVQTRVFGISETGGNPCSVIFNANNFTDEQMQSLCAKFNDDCSPIQSVSTSRPKLMIPLKNWQTLDRIKPNFEELWKLCNLYQTTGFYPFTLKPRDSRFHAEARQFPNQAGYDEDPATGIAACALGAYLTHYSLFQQCADGATNYSIGQGNAMGKDSRINVKIDVRDREITRVQVGGTAEIVADRQLSPS
jgi:PhzF family phenazine biosynthesis protein